MKKSQALTTLKLTLKPEHQKLIEAKLNTGRYANPDEIIAEALQLLSKRDHYQQWAIEFDPPQSPVRTSAWDFGVRLRRETSAWAQSNARSNADLTAEALKKGTFLKRRRNWRGNRDTISDRPINLYNIL